jgi:hypothetical protein
MQGNIKLTARKALEVQATQLDYYCVDKPYGERVRAKIVEQTNIEGLDLDEELPAHIINLHVPRGGAIETLVCAAIAAQQQRDRDSYQESNANQPELTEGGCPQEAPTYDDLETAYLSGEATMDVDRVNHREFVWQGIRYTCGWSSEKSGDSVIGWIILQDLTEDV